RVSDLIQAKEMLLSVLDNQPGPARDIVSLNAGAAIYISGIAPSLSQGIAVAQETLASGAAKAKLQALVNYSRREAH
ncbi:MAG TPA: anthranilate phosphoribosyltransferase, partial [Nitrosomonas sp.]|nr:anthranilate phosphoribosyltransferase [Nitrosomonas sp.]